MPLPNTAGTQFSGVDPNSVQKKNDLEQSINNTLREIQLKMDNIMNVRGNIQAGVYGAFGNNFLSRGMMEISDSISDAISGLFTEPEKEKEDPVVKTLREQTTLLGSKIDKSTKANVDVEDQIILLRQDIKKTHELDRADIIEQDQILETILTALTGTQAQTQPTNQQKEFEFDFESDEQPKPEPMDRGPTIIDAQEPPDKPETRENHIPTLLKRILQTLFNTNKSLDALLKAQPMSTRESEIEALTSKNSALDKSRSVEDIKTVDEGGKRGFDWSRLLTGLTDFDANMRGMKNVVDFVMGGLKSAFTGLLTVLSPLGAGLMKLASIIGSTISSIATTAMPAIAGIAKTALKFAAPAAVMGLTVAGIDAAAGAMGVGENAIDTAQDDANWEKMSTLEKIQSGVARGIEKTGEILFMDNITNEARANRIKSETLYLEKKQTEAASKSVEIGKVQSEGLTTIEATQKDIANANRLKEHAVAGSKVAPVVQDNRVTNNQTIMPTRTVVENQESGYRRYMQNILVPR